MTKSGLTAAKVETADIAANETFFRDVFAFGIWERYGSPDEAFEEVVMTLNGEPGTMLKFIRINDRPADATGATVQIAVADCDASVAAALAAGATLKTPATDYPEAGVRMGVVTTTGGLDVEVVHYR